MAERCATCDRSNLERPSAFASAEVAAGPVAPGALIDILGSRFRSVALFGERVFLLSTLTHHPFLVQEEPDGPIVVPTIASILRMIEIGDATVVRRSRRRRSESARMKVQIDLLDAAEVAQGEKAIWIFMATNWTPALQAEFGPHDDPIKIRRWRTALRKAIALRRRDRSRSASD